jgi:hypothetical protein
VDKGWNLRKMFLLLCFGLVGCSRTPTSEGSPLSKAVGFGGSASEQQAYLQSEIRNGQQRVAACMKREGFAYLVNPSKNDTKPIRSSRAWKRQFGYGFTLGLREPHADPSVAGKARLSSSERAAYDKALYGTSSPDGEVLQYGTGLGCLTRRLAKKTAQAFELLRPKLEELNRKVNLDPKSF